VFRELEEQQLLNVDSDLDIVALHHSFSRRIQAALDAFVSSWIHHPLSSMRNKSPAY
jgi:hypothetical protein